MPFFLLEELPLQRKSVSRSAGSGFGCVIGNIGLPYTIYMYCYVPSVVVIAASRGYFGRSKG